MEVYTGPSLGWSGEVSPLVGVALVPMVKLGGVRLGLGFTGCSQLEHARYAAELHHERPTEPRSAQRRRARTHGASEAEEAAQAGPGLREGNTEAVQDGVRQGPRGWTEGGAGAVSHASGQ